MAHKLHSLDLMFQLATLVWFIVGQGSIMGTPPSACRVLFFYCVAVSVCTYFTMFLPCIVLLLACFRTPCLLLLAEILSRHSTDVRRQQIDTLRVVQFESNEQLCVETDRDIEAGEEQKCAVCLREYEVDDTIRVLGCNHFYHKSCVDPWLRVKSSCPVCRQPIANARDFRGTGKRYTTNTTQRIREKTPVGE